MAVELSGDWYENDDVLLNYDVKNPARGHKVEKHHPEGKNVRRTLHTKKKRQWYKKYSEKATSPNKQKGKKETRAAIGFQMKWLINGPHFWRSQSILLG